MKSYQDPDPLHGNGKAVPKPKQPTRYTYRGGSLGGIHRRVFRSDFIEAKQKHSAVRASTGMNLWSVTALIAACLGFHRGR